jgi:predicted NBD/HSP70 family sugar kinase
MKNLQTGNRKLIRQINRSIVLNVIKNQGEISRAAIAQFTGLSPATVTGITGHLIDENLVFEKHTEDSAIGRPPILLALNPCGGFVIGIKQMDMGAIGALTDLNGNILAKKTVTLSDNQFETCINMLLELIEHLINSSDIKRKQLMGVGIGIAGVVDFKNGVVKQNPFLGWKNIFLRDALQDRINIPVYLDNDVNTLTQSERWLNSGQTEDNFIVITIGRGIGMGIVINGQIYRGKSGGAGEFGHTVIDPDGPRCNCGQHGCLESLISDPALLTKARQVIGEEITDLDDLIQQANAGHKEAIKILSHAGMLLVRQIANIVNIFDPNLIIISGEGVHRGEIFFSALEKAFRKFIMAGLAEDTEIRIDPWGDDIWALGAASLVIGEIFKSPIEKEGLSKN